MPLRALFLVLSVSCGGILLQEGQFVEFTGDYSNIFDVLKITTIAEYVNTVDPDEMDHNEPSHRDIQCLPPRV